MNKSNVEKAHQFFKDYPGHLKTATDEIAERLNVSYDNVCDGRNEYKKQLRRNEIKSKEDFVEKAKVYDSVDDYQQFLKDNGIKEEDVVQVYYKQKADGIRFTVQTRFDKEDKLNKKDVIEEFKKEIQQYSPPDYSKKQYTNYRNETIGVISLFDAHLDKISLIDETDEESSLDKNIKLFEEAFDDVLDSLLIKNPEKIIFPFGNDFWHTNDEMLGTKAGTNMSDRVHETGIQAFRLGLNLLRRCIDKIRNYCPVVLIPVRGNHDKDRINYLLETLLVAYENQQDVEVIDSRKSRLYYRYGTWLFGFAHGDNVKKADQLPSLMSTDKDSRKHWSEIDRGVFFLGHLHHEKKYHFMNSQDFRGCKVMFLRSVSTTDEWHWSKGFTGNPKTAYGFYYDKDGKKDGEFKVNI